MVIIKCQIAVVYDIVVLVVVAAIYMNMFCIFNRFKAPDEVFSSFVSSQLTFVH